MSYSDNCTQLSSLPEEEVAICLDRRNDELQLSIDTVWVLVTAIGILSLQVGFAMLEAGTVQTKNVKSVLMKNLSDMVFGTLIWWLVGYGLYKGDNVFAGGLPNLFVIMEEQSIEYPEFVQQYGFAITAATIVSGSVLSRIKFETYVVFSIVFVSVVYSIAAHMSWADNGWLYALGYIDFAGSGVVHMVGGVAGLVGSILVGPRVGRFYAEDEEAPGAVRKLMPHSTVLLVLGGFMLYIGWYSFNAGSSGGMGPNDILSAKRAMMNTLLASAAGGAIVTMYSLRYKNQHDVPLTVNGMLCGLVAITGPCAHVDTWAALLIGSTAALLYIPAAYNLLHRFKIDDPVNAFPVHGISGAYGVIVTGIFAFSEDGGLIYTGSFYLLGVQILGVLALSFWSIVCSAILFLILKFTMGLRVEFDDQLLGLDDTYHAGSAYPEFDYITVREFDATRRRGSFSVSGNTRRESFRRYGSSAVSVNETMKNGNGEITSARRIHFV